VIIAGIIAIIYRPFSTYIRFVYPNARFEAIGNPYITAKELNRIIENKNLDSFIDILNSNKDYKIVGESILKLQKSLDNNLIETIGMMQKDSSKKMKKFYYTYLEKFDIYLIKHVLKNKMQDNEINKDIINEAIHVKTKKILQEIIDAEKSKIPQILKYYGFPNSVINVFSEELVDFLKIDNELDRFIIEKFRHIEVPYKCINGINKFVNYLIDIVNIKHILRAKQLGYNNESLSKLFLGEGQEIASWKYKELLECESISQLISALQGTSFYDPLKNIIEDYNKKNSVQVLENVLDRHFLKIVKDISLENYVTIGPTIRFIVSKEFEIKNLKIIAKGIGEGISSDIIKSILISEAKL
jgi:V/A-type H+-transporting ATPase subunit C